MITVSHSVMIITLDSGFYNFYKVKVYDSVYTTINKETKAAISNLYGPIVSPRLVNISKQKGGADCGLFVIAIATTLVPAEIKYST